MYQLTESGIVRLEDMAFIPINPVNIEYREYQEWLQEGNEPLPAPVELSAVAISNGEARQSRIRQQQAADIESRISTLEQANTGN